MLAFPIFCSLALFISKKIDAFCWIIFPLYRGKGDGDGDKRELVFKEDGQEYALITKMLGNGWLEVNCCDGTKRMAHIRGAFRKKVWYALLFTQAAFMLDDC